MKLAYYPGCSLDGSGVEYGMSMKRTAEILGIELLELEDWNCCGATSGHNTNRLLSLALPARNIAIAERSGLNMVAPCAACYNRHRTVEHVIHSDPGMKEKIEQVIEMPLNGTTETLSILDVLANKLGTETIKAKVSNPLTGMKAACYYGCLLVRPTEHTGFDDAEDPQSMDNIMQALGAQTIDWSFKTECCGASLVTSRPDVGNPMLSKVIQNAMEAGAECIVTACPLCLMNLDMRQTAAEKSARKKFNIPIYYITELLAVACGDQPKTVGVHKHFVEAEKYLTVVKERAAQAQREAADLAAKQKQEAEAKEQAKLREQQDKESAGSETGTTAAADDPEALKKKVDAFVAAFTKNPDKMAAKLIDNADRVKILAEIIISDAKKTAKLAELMVSDKEKAAKAADAFVTAELKKREK